MNIEYLNKNMISFRFKNQVKKVKIKTKQKIDERMSRWLQKVFSFKNQIIGFKSQDHKTYDVQSFFNGVEKFFGTTVDIIQAGDQLQISFTSQNLNSSSFVRPSQPNTSEINHKELSQDQFEDFVFVTDRKSFQKMVQQGKDVSVLFDINGVYRKAIMQSGKQLLNNKYTFNINLYMYINNSHPKKSCFSIYIGKSCVVTFSLVKDYIEKIKLFLNRYKKSSTLIQKQNKVLMQAKGSHQQQDEAPSFTTYHLQERLNQQACSDYLTRMYKQDRCLRNFQYRKLMQKCEQNYNQFYRLFCEGIMDNDYQSFRNEILHRVDNNLQLILSNVDEMDLSRPISREEQRRNNLKKSVPEIQIVKVENYFEILDQLKHQLSHDMITEIKQLLLDEDRQFHSYFSQYLSRQFSQDVLATKLINSLQKRKQKSRPISRYIPGKPVKSKSVDPIRRNDFDEELENQIRKNQQKQTQLQKANDFLIEENINNRVEEVNKNNGLDKIITNRVDQVQNNVVEEAPMFGSVKNQENFSPIKFMSDMESNYKHAWTKLAEKSEEFQPEEYGLLYHLLQKRDDSISNFIQQLDWNENEAIANIKQLLKEKISSIFEQNFNPSQISYISSHKDSHPLNFIFENFKYESDLSTFISSLKQQLGKISPMSYESKTLHKKSSDSQLLENKQRNIIKFARRKFSDQNVLDIDQRSPSPKDSQYSLCNKNSVIPDMIEMVKLQWRRQFEEMIKQMDFSEQGKQDLIRQLYRTGNPRVFGWIRNHIKGNRQYFGSQQIQDLKQNQRDLRFLLSILPIYDQFLRLFVQDGLISDKIRKWTISEVLTQNMTLMSAFELYLQTKQEGDFVETICMIYQGQNKQMEFYNTYIRRLQALLKEMSINDEVGMEVFTYFPDSIKSLCQLYFITGNLQDMMDTLEVLYKKQAQLRRIKVATLNFSGINTSPFEYFDGSQQLTKLDELFLKNLQIQRPGIEKWNIGKIDKIVQNRFSISYLNGFESIKNQKLLNRSQFEQMWRSKFPNITELTVPVKQQQIKQCITFDWIVYLTILQYVYQMQKSFATSIDFENSLNELSSEKLIAFLQEKRNKPQCRIEVKRQLVIEFLLKQSIDVLFLQQAGCVDWNDDLVKQYACVKNSDSIIIFNKAKIGQIKLNLQQKYANELNFNNDSACLFTDKNYLLLSIHLSANKKNIQQFKNVIETLERILNDHPMLKLVVGTDANHFIQEEVLPQSLNLTRQPDNQSIPTTLKKRTHLQAQLPKANQLVSEVKDFIITNRKIESSEIVNIQGEVIDEKSIENQLIPNDTHPYDHFSVRAQIV